MHVLDFFHNICQGTIPYLSRPYLCCAIGAAILDNPGSPNPISSEVYVSNPNNVSLSGNGRLSKLSINFFVLLQNNFIAVPVRNSVYCTEITILRTPIRVEGRFNVFTNSRQYCLPLHSQQNQRLLCF